MKILKNLFKVNSTKWIKGNRQEVKHFLSGPPFQNLKGMIRLYEYQYAPNSR